LERASFSFQLDKEKGSVDACLQALDNYGFTVMEDVCSDSLLERTLAAIDEGRASLLEKVDRDLLIERGEFPQLRFPMCFNPVFFEFLQLQPLLSVIDGFCEDSLVLRFQSAQRVFPNDERSFSKQVYHHFHRNFRHLQLEPGNILECVMPISDITADNGVILVFPGSHRWRDVPADEELKNRTEELVAIEAPAGSMVLLDGMTVHREEFNYSKKPLDLVLHQFVPSVIKQHADYCRAIDPAVMESLPDRALFLLGEENRVPASIEEYYRPMSDAEMKSMALQFMVSEYAGE
jgi:ectoine hydroxylase-related dioxygenase (phytanoyl-CoA dioxygenase family)